MSPTLGFLFAIPCFSRYKLRVRIRDELNRIETGGGRENRLRLSKVPRTWKRLFLVEEGGWRPIGRRQRRATLLLSNVKRSLRRHLNLLDTMSLLLLPDPWKLDNFIRGKLEFFSAALSVHLSIYGHTRSFKHAQTHFEHFILRSVINYQSHTQRSLLL